MATEWGKTNEPVARQEYIKLNAEDHKKTSVVETGLFVSCENPIFGASPDGIVSCECHESGLLEIRCSWTHRQISNRLCKTRRVLFRIRGHRQCSSIKKITQLLLSGVNAAGNYWVFLV